MGAWTTYSPLMINNPNDGGIPVYVASNSDPSYTIHCTSYACSSLEGLSVHIPAGFSVEYGGAGDAHLVVISPDKSATYEMYQVKQPSGSTLNIGSGSKFATGGIGWESTWGGSANASESSFVAGVVTAEDLLQGSINHALMVGAPCGNGRVYPARPNADLSCSSGNGAPFGARLWLSLTDAQINALNLGVTKTIVAKALAHYGAFITDTVGGPNEWALLRSAASGPSSEAAAWQSVQSTLLGGSTTWLSDNWPSAVVNSFRFLDPCITQVTC
jgi:hypothetical protein